MPPFFLMKLELFHWDCYKKSIPILDKNRNPIDVDMNATFSIYKDGKLEWIQELKKENGKIDFELSEDDISMFTPWERKGEIKVKIGKRTKRAEFDIVIYS